MFESRLIVAVVSVLIFEVLAAWAGTPLDARDAVGILLAVVVYVSWPRLTGRG